MATFLMFGKYSSESMKRISAARTQKIRSLIRKLGGQAKAMYTVLGEIDLVFIVAFPGVEQAIKASVAMTKLTGISFNTCPAVTVEEFDKILAKG